MVMRITGQDRQYCPRPQAHTAIDHPEETIGKGGVAQGQAPQGPSRVEAHDGKPDDPMDDGVRTRCARDAEGPGQESTDARGRAKANASDEKELESHVDHLDCGHGGEAVQLGLELTQAGLRLCERMPGPVGLRREASGVFALVALPLASQFGFVLPLVATGCQLRQLTHDGASTPCDGPRPSQVDEMGSRMRP